MESVGDLARTLVLRSNQMRLRQEMDQLAVEVATGFVKDPAAHLKGDTTGLLAIDRALARIEAFRLTGSEAALLTGTMQETFDEIQARNESLANTLLSSTLTRSPALLATTSQDAANTLDQVLTAMNRSVAGRFLFSGSATDTPAVPDFETVMDELRAAVAGETSLGGIDDQLEVFFASGGAFETTIYQGSTTGLVDLQLSENERVSFDIRATDPVFRELLKPIAMAALAADSSLSFDTELQVELLSQAGRDALGTQQSLVETRAALGSLQNRVEESTVRNAAQKTSLSIARLDLVGTDDYETATKYENVRAQLESLYAITVRSQRLSLAEYL